MLFSDYRSDTFDELIDVDGHPRDAAASLVKHLERMGIEELEARQQAANLGIEAAGITFTVYTEGTGIDRAWPFDIVPRVISRRDWDRVDAGLVQRLTALNHFIADVYAEQKIFADGIVPFDLI
ncbi:MAG TPA: circularly permuted type 2 ATP-grasp protein, partial [Microthrixaceae bacterium]|nr:circularly permuted type 2 ATP-grasp protein [Microthrixaceae bacterium]